MDEKIEEMANDLEEEFVLCGILSNCGTKRCSRCFSKYLYEQGYRKESDTAREIWGDCIDKIMRGCGDDKEFWVMKILIETFKKFGVGFEVESWLI